MVSSEGRSWIASTLRSGDTIALTAVSASAGSSVATIQISNVRPPDADLSASTRTKIAPGIYDIRWGAPSGFSDREISHTPAVQPVTIGDQNSRTPLATGRSGAISTTAPVASGKPSTSTSDMNLPICRGGKL